jgi:hypothetical protein
VDKPSRAHARRALTVDDTKWLPMIPTLDCFGESGCFRSKIGLDTAIAA